MIVFFLQAVAILTIISVVGWVATKVLEKLGVRIDDE